MRFRHVIGFLWLFVSPWLCAQTSTLVNVKPVFGHMPLVLRSQLYISQTGDSVYVDGFRFYMSNLRFLKGGRTVYAEKDSYHLLDADDSTSLSFGVNMPPVSYDAIYFMIGVDSLANVSGALDGALDPVKGMYWAWNTGYIHAKLEGHSPSCKTLHRAFEFHIGGYTMPYRSSREVTVSVGSSTTKENPGIYLEADAGAWLQHISLKTTNSVVMPSAEAMRVADNYQTMFRLNRTP